MILTYLSDTTELILAVKARDLIVASDRQNILAENDWSLVGTVIVVLTTTLDLLYEYMLVLLRPLSTSNLQS